MKYTKADIQFHSDGFGRQGRPAVNVKCRNWPRASEIAKRLNCSEELAQKASEFAYESAVESFWEQTQELAEFCLKDSSVKVYSEGRSSGWLVVEGLPEVEAWNAVAVGRWRKLVNSIREDIAWRCSLEQVCQSIEANQWHKQGAELYNFVDRADGSPVCLADMKADAIKAGFAPVVR